MTGQTKPLSDPECAQCGVLFRSGDRFCAQCGHAAGSPTPARARKPGKRGRLAIAMVLMVACTAAVLQFANRSGNATQPNTLRMSTVRNTITGTIILEHPDITATTDGCRIPRPDQDLVIGSPVSVVDSAGTAIAIGGVVHTRLESAGVCHMLFGIAGVPAAAEYRLLIDGTAMSPILRSTLEMGGWRIDVRLSDLLAAASD